MITGAKEPQRDEGDEGRVGEDAEADEPAHGSSRSLKPTPRTVSTREGEAPASSSLRRRPFRWESTVRSVSA